MRLYLVAYVLGWQATKLFVPRVTELYSQCNMNRMTWFLCVRQSTRRKVASVVHQWYRPSRSSTFYAPRRRLILLAIQYVFSWVFPPDGYIKLVEHPSSWQYSDPRKSIWHRRSFKKSWLGSTDLLALITQRVSSSRWAPQYDDDTGSSTPATTHTRKS